MTKSRACYPSSAAVSSSSSKLGMETNSHMISKLKPRIRIIHLYAPEIIKTDAENFRELVQRLTGKPEEEEKGGGRRKKKSPPSRDSEMDFHSEKGIVMKEDEEDEDEKEFLGLQNGIRMIKKEDRGEDEEDNNEKWGRSRSNEKFSGGFFDGFSELDGFMEELSTMPLV